VVPGWTGAFVEEGAPGVEEGGTGVWPAISSIRQSISKSVKQKMSFTSLPSRQKACHFISRRRKERPQQKIAKCYKIDFSSGIFSPFCFFTLTGFHPEKEKKRDKKMARNVPILK
jgi:hypothetical protein